MSEIKKIIDLNEEYPLEFEIVDSGRPNIKKLIPESGQNNSSIATVIDSELLTNIQKNAVYEVETTHTINNSIDYYSCSISGLTEFGIYKNLFLKVLIDMSNEFDHPKLKLNDIDYTLLYKPENETYKPLLTGMLKAGQYYNLVFNGSQFVIENGSLPATLDSAGTLSLTDIRKEISGLSGATYSGVFGVDLKNIVAGKSYIYFDATGKGTIYKAITTKASTTGFLVPNSTDFLDITNNTINEKYMRNIEDYEFAEYPTTLGMFRFWRYGKRVFYFLFYQSTIGFTLTAGAKISDFPSEKFYPHVAFMNTEHALIIKNSTNQECARMVIRTDGLYVYGANAGIINELKGTMHYIAN